MASYTITKDSFAKDGTIEILVFGLHIPAEGYPIAVRGDGLSRVQVLELCAHSAEEAEANFIARHG